MKKRVLLIVLLLAAIATPLWWFKLRPTDPNRGTLTLYGNVDIREVNLAFRVPGKLLEVSRDEGDAVKAGDIVARLDDEPFRREVEESRAQLASVQARLQLVQAGNRPQEIAQARSLERELEVTAANAERVFHRQQELLNTKAVSLQERDDAEARFREADARLKSARERRALLEEGFRAEDIAQAKAEVSRAEALLGSAELRARDTVLKAPADGVVITRAQEPGAVVQIGATVLTLSLKEPVWVRAYISEPDLGRIHPGLKVQVYTDTHPNRPYDGQVGYISPRAEFTPKNVETADLRTSLVYRLRVVVSRPDEGLRQGMPVTLKLVPPTAMTTPTK